MATAARRLHRPDGPGACSLSPHIVLRESGLPDGTRLREGPAIVQYIADQVPARNLAPANGTLPRYRVQEWLTFIGTELHKTFSPLFNPAVPEEAKAVFRDKLTARFRWVDGQLAGKSYLTGDAFCVADAYLYTVSRWCGVMKIDLSSMANLVAFQHRMLERPAVKEALRAEGLLK